MYNYQFEFIKEIPLFNRSLQDDLKHKINFDTLQTVKTTAVSLDCISITLNIEK